jgi:hypothetical protein
MAGATRQECGMGTVAGEGKGRLATRLMPGFDAGHLSDLESGRGRPPSLVRHWITPMLTVIVIAFLFCTAFYVLDAVLLGGGVRSVSGVFQHYFSFDAELITDALPALGMTIVAVLGIVLTVVAIIVQLSSDRYTGVAIMFLREPVHIAVLSFYIVASLCAIWLSVTLRPDFVPRSLLIVVMILTSLGLAVMLPYFAYTFWFLEPGNIIDRLRRHTSGLSRQGLEAVSEIEVNHLQGTVLSRLEEITDIANNSIEGRDKIIAGRAVDSLCEFVVDYISTKPQEDRPWFRIGRALRINPDFVGMDKELIDEIENRRLWVEWKTLHELLRVYQEALPSMGDIDSHVAINTRYIGEVGGVTRQRDLIRMVMRFLNYYLREAIFKGSARTAEDVMLQYRLLIETLLRENLCDVVCEGAGFLEDFGHIAFEEDLTTVTETVAHDLAYLCRYAHLVQSVCEMLMLRQLLALDEEHATRSHRQSRGLRGVRTAQVRLAVYYLAAGEESKARMIAEDMRDMSATMKASVRDQLARENPPHFWETIDRGRNLHYLSKPEREQLDTFLGWVAG